jgi:ATP-binding cassette subfamily B protein RaxB
MKLEPVLQAESAECGLACVAMVARHWGHDTDLATLRRRFLISSKGSTLRQLLDIATALGLQPRPLRVSLAELRALPLPAILHWDMNHFVVLQRAGRRLHLLDPAAGTRCLRSEEASAHFTGVAVELGPGPGFERRHERPRLSLRALLGPVRGLKRGLLQLLTLSLCLQLCTLLAPYYLQWVVDDAIAAGDHGLLNLLGTAVLLMLLWQVAITVVRSWSATVLATQLNFQWLGRVFAHLLRLPLAYFEARHLGDVISRFGAVQALQRLLTTQFVEGVIDGVLVVATAALMLRFSVQLTMLAACSVSLYALLRAALLPSLRYATAEQLVQAARAQTQFLESVRGVQTLRLFGRTAERCNGWLHCLAGQYNCELRIARLSIGAQAANALLFGAERTAVIWLAALAAMRGEFSIGMLIAFLSYKEQFSQRLAALIDKCCDVRLMRVQAERLADIVLHEPEPQGDALATLHAVGAGWTIELREVLFRYADGEPPVLQHLNLFVPAGQSLAITGVSGSGKSTLIKLLLGLHLPTRGEILIAGRPLRQWPLAAYRRALGTVLQDDRLFAGTIADNICCFDPQPDTERLLRSAALAALHAEIVAHPMGYQSLLGENGQGLSGGQRQRLLLARALYAQPKILVLDEATSHLDLEGERQVNAAIAELALTRIIVAHRTETVASAQRVITLERGMIVSDRMQ